MTQTAPGSLVIRTELQPDKEGPMLGLLLPQSTSFETWKTVGGRLMRQGRSWPWKVGDWLWFGEGAYGKRYQEAIETTGLEYQTLANYKNVAGRFEIYRRREDLTFAHHAEVASMGSDEEQDQWLEKAAREGWTIRELRTAIKERDALPEADLTEARDATGQDTDGPGESASERALSEEESLEGSRNGEMVVASPPSSESALIEAIRECDRQAGYDPTIDRIIIPRKLWNAVREAAGLMEEAA